MNDVDRATGVDFSEKVTRLSRASVGVGFDAYRDIDWDSDEMTVDPTDRRFVLPASDPLANTTWYHSLPADDQARVGLVRLVASLKTAVHFENILQQGLLHRALYLDSGAAEFRYIHHEVIEESQHTLMFNEFISRSGLKVRGMPWALRRFTELLVPILSQYSPGVFFMMVLGGEEPLDLLQRRALDTSELHPLIEKIMRVHIAEESRHISYARAAVRHEVPQLGRVRRQLLAFFCPLILGIMVRLMVVPGRDLSKVAGVPKDVLREAFGGPEGRRVLADSVARSRNLLREQGAITPVGRLVWKAFGIWS
ncbi:MAG: diiron oxygenase [Microthrixaceae bacterium]